MDESKVKEIVDANLKQLCWALQLQKWDIKVSYEHLHEDDVISMAECTANPRHHWAAIVIDPAQHKSEEDVLKSLRHELLHCMASLFETYRKAVGQLLDDKVFDAIDVFFRDASEVTVWRIEQMLDFGLKKEEPDDTTHTSVGVAAEKRPANADL